MKRIVVVISVVLFHSIVAAQSKKVLKTAVAADTSKTHQPGAALPNGQVPYQSLITAAAKTMSGYFKVHVLSDRYYFDIPDSMLNRDILVINRIVNGIQGSGQFADDQLGADKVIRFRKLADKITLNIMNFTVMGKDTASQMFKAINNSNQPAVIASFDIKALSKDGKGSIFDMTDMIKGGAGIMTNQSADYIGFVKAYTTNIEIRTYRREGPFRNTNIVAPVEINTSFILLPKVPMRPRYYDERVGFFKTEHTDFDENPQQVKKVNFICRWRMEPKDEDLAKYKQGILVEPKNPIVYYIDPATPKKWVPYLIKGVNDWQKAFEKAGFKNAIYARVAPTREQDSTWDLAACRAAIAYKPSDEQNASGPMNFDPRSGEIIQSHINWNHNIMKILHDWYMIQAGINDPGGRKMVFDDDLMGLLIQRALSHEIGHTLGLEHNFGSSSTIPVEKLRDKAWTEEHGHTPSIMDYARFNYVAQPGDGVSRKGLMLRIGDYDLWAIEWGYKLFPQYKTPADEKVYLNKWLHEKLKDSRLWYGNGDHGFTSDPRSQAEDLGDDGVKASEYGIKNLQRTLPHLIEWTTKESETYDNLRDLYRGKSGLINQYSFYMGHVTNIIGGRYRTPVVAGDTTPFYKPVPAEKQKAAVNFLNQQLFLTPQWLLDKSILSKTGDNPVTLIGDVQHHTLTMVLGKLDSLAAAEAIPGGKAYTPANLLNDLQKGIWAELYTHQPIDQFRVNLQLNYLGEIKKVLDMQQRQEQSYQSGIIKANLSSIKKDVTADLAFVTDPQTLYHLHDVLENIDVLLKYTPMFSAQKN